MEDRDRVISDRQRIRNEIRMEKIEWGVSFDAKDTEQFRIKGTEEHVELTDDQRKRIYRECISFIHNHPFYHQQIFSENDLLFFISYPKMREFEVVNMDGSYIISKDSPIGDTKRKKYRGYYNKFLKIYHNSVERNLDDLEKWADEGAITKKRMVAYAMALDRIAFLGTMKRIAKVTDGRIKLTFIPLNERTKAKIEMDNEALRQLDEAIDKVGIDRIIKENMKVHAEIIHKDFLTNKVLEDIKYDPKAELDEKIQM